MVGPEVARWDQNTGPDTSGPCQFQQRTDSSVARGTSSAEPEA